MNKGKKPIINSLWIGDRLSPLEILTIKSFQHHGYTFRLWIYEDVVNVPEHVLISNAGEIIQSGDVFSYTKANKYGHGKGSFAGFSDIFRYKLLYEHGGIWVDMDMTCLKPMNHNVEYIFRYHKQLGIVGNYIQCPPKSELMLWCYNRAIQEVKSDNTDWLLPIRILNEGVNQFNLSGYVQKFSNEDEFPLIQKMLKTNYKINNEWFVIHWMNEEFRRLNLNKWRVLEGSTLESMYKIFEINIIRFSKKEKLITLIKLNRIYYLCLNIISRFKWISNLLKR